MCINPDFALALEHALRYREMGLTPLPSRMDDKRPMLNGYAQYRQEPVPDALYTPENWKTSNIQLLTGACVQGATRGRHGLLRILVVDLDGPEARKTFKKLCNQRYMAKEYWVVRSPSGGAHIYFEIPDDVEYITTRMIWGLIDPEARAGQPGWVKHCEIKILGDGALAVAPPSIHVDHRDKKGRYKFQNGFSPEVFPRPMLAPDWLLSFKAAKLPEKKIGPVARNVPARPISLPFPEGPVEANLNDIANSISPDQKIAYLREWGVRFVGEINQRGWINCHSILAEDSVPSAGVFAATGVYKDHITTQKLYFFEMGVKLGMFRSVWDCAKWCAYGRR